MEAELTSVRDDAPGGAHVQLAAASDQVVAHLARVGEGADLDAVPLLVSQAGDALLDRGMVRAALDVQEYVAVPGEGLEELRGGDLVEEGAESGRGPDRDEAAAARQRGASCGCGGLVSSTTINKIKIINSLALVLTSLTSGGRVRARAGTAGPVAVDAVDAVDHRGGGELDLRRAMEGSGANPTAKKAERVHDFELIAAAESSWWCR